MTVSSTTADAPDATTVTPANPDETLRAVSITERIKYIHCEGGHGVMTFSSVAGVPMFVKEVSSQEDFKLNYNVFRMMEDLI